MFCTVVLTRSFLVWCEIDMKYYQDITLFVLSHSCTNGSVTIPVSLLTTAALGICQSISIQLETGAELRYHIAFIFFKRQRHKT